jgi:hypothetical protein
MRLRDNRLPKVIAESLVLDQVRRLIAKHKPKIRKTRLYAEKIKPPIVCRVCADQPDEQFVLYLKQDGWTKFERTKVGDIVKRNATCPKCKGKK